MPARVSIAALAVLGLLPMTSGQASTVITVNTATDSDAACTTDECSLREAIELSNNLAGKDTIVFNIPGDPPAPIRPVADMPAVTDPAVLDGTTQPGYQGAPIVEIDGSLMNEPGNYGDGLLLWASDSLIRGFVIHGFEGGDGILVQGNRFPGDVGGHRNVIQNNYIGTTRDGRSPSGNFVGIALSNTQGTLIGGTQPSEANVISGNYEGISVSPGSGAGTRVVGNLIGTDPTGTVAVGNTGQAIRLDGSNYTFGGPGAGEGNVISGNNGDGFEVVTPNAFGNVIQGNRIGVTRTGAPLGNTGGVGVVFVFDPHDNLVGGTEPGQANVIAHNGYGGIAVNGGVRNQFLGNSIYSNAQLGIDLLVSSSSGPTPNDPGDSDEGSNNLQNRPRIVSAAVTGSTIDVTAALSSTPNSTYRIEFFDNRTCDPSGSGEGEVFLGSASVTTNDIGEGSVSASFPAPAFAAHLVTATATDSSGNTSEFSRCFNTDGSGAEPDPTSSPTPGSTPSPGTTPKPGTADVSVTQSVHHARRYFTEPGPELEGDPEIPDELWFIYEIKNAGPAATEVEFRAHPDTFLYKSPGRGEFDFWTIPMRTTGAYESGSSNCTRNYVCRLHLRPGRMYTYIISAEANAPGRFSIKAAAWGEAPDPDSTNNRTGLFDHRVRCKIEGTSGPDRLVATEAPDSICGGDGNDRLIAVGDRDKIFGQAGNDVLSGRPGNNQSFLGGGGVDIATFKDSPRAVTVALHVRTAGGRDAYQIEGAVGSRFGDYMTGLLGSDELWGGPGNDRIAGRSGRDRASGGTGDDRFITVDGAFDRVSGGRGDDLTQSDGGDDVSSATRTSSPTFYLDPV